MKALKLPRFVVLTRRTPLVKLLEHHGTLAQARFSLETRGQALAPYEDGHARFESGLARVLEAVPPERRLVRLDREQLDRFLFAPDDVLVVVGQDGLVPNAAKYLAGQLTVGINPDPERYDGVLCPHPPATAATLFAWVDRGEGPAYRVQHRVMALAEREDGQRLLALNEVFVGHRTHQSARYRLRAGEREERQSSSGLICATGTGSTGWARSISLQRGLEAELPEPEEPRLVFLVREPFPSVATGVALDFGALGPEQRLEVVSEMGDDGVVFADGIESDRIEFLDGATLRVSVAPQRLNLLVRAA